jgi:hypothetical protein
MRTMIAMMVVLAACGEADDDQVNETDAGIEPAATVLRAEGAGCERDEQCEHGTCLVMGGIGACSSQCELQEDCPGFDGGAPGSGLCFEAGETDYCLQVCADPSGRSEPCPDGSTCWFAALPSWYACWPDAPPTAPEETIAR